MSNRHGFWGNPPQAAAHMAGNILPWVEEPVAGLIGFFLFFATIILLSSLIVLFLRKVHGVWVSAHSRRGVTKRDGRCPQPHK